MPAKKTVAKATKKAPAKKAPKVEKNPILDVEEEVEETQEVKEEEVDEAEAMEQETVAKQVAKIPATPKKEIVSQPAPAGSPANAMKVYQDNVAATREKLMNGPKTFFVVPLDPGEKPGAVETVNINGFKLTIKKGALVEVPVAVMKVLANYYKVSLEAGQDKLIDRDERHDGISMTDALI